MHNFIFTSIIFEMWLKRSAECASINSKLKYTLMSFILKQIHL